METKSLFASKTFWGAIIAGASGLAAAIFGVTVAPEEQEAIIAGVTAVGAVSGTVLAIIGRIRAAKAIK